VHLLQTYSRIHSKSITKHSMTDDLSNIITSCSLLFTRPTCAKTIIEDDRALGATTFYTNSTYLPHPISELISQVTSYNYPKVVLLPRQRAAVQPTLEADFGSYTSKSLAMLDGA
jgi:hypothetical protein